MVGSLQDWLKQSNPLNPNNLLNPQTGQSFGYTSKKQSGVYVPNLAETMAQQSFASPFQISQKTITPATISPVSPTTTPPPVVSAKTSDVSAQAAALSQSLESIKQQVLEYQKQQQEQQQLQQQEQPKEQSATEKMFQSLMGQQQQVQQQVQQSQQNLLDQQNAIYEKWGLTPEKYQRIENLTTQIADYQKQLTDIDTREQQALEAIGSRPGIDLAFMSGEQARISRAYTIQKSGVAAQASILASEANALQGNWDNAFKSAQLYVDNATKAQQQYVSDLKWGFENYSDIIQTMTEQEQNQIKMIMDSQNKELDRQQDDYWNRINANFKQQGLEIDWYKAQASGGANLDTLAQAVITNPSLFGMFTPTQRANLTPRLQELGFDITQLQPTTFIGKAKEAVAAFQSSANMLDTIEIMANKVLTARTAAGAWWQWGAKTLGAWAKTNQDAMVYRDTMSTFRSLLTRAAGEKGVLTQRDVENIQKALPQFGDPEEVWRQKLINMRTLYLSIMTGTQEAYLGTSTQSGEDNDPLRIR